MVDRISSGAGLADSVQDALERFHSAYPQLLGIGVERLADMLDPQMQGEVAEAAIRGLIAKGVLVCEGGRVRLPGHRLALDMRDCRLWQRILPHLSGEQRFRPPQGRECADILAEHEFDVRRVLKAMTRQNHVVELAPDRFFLRETVREMAVIAGEMADGEQDGLFSAALFRDRLNNGRRVAIEILEFFDSQGLTMREGGLRRVVQKRVAEYAGRHGAPAALPDVRFG